jgi:hypothetical protein
VHSRAISTRSETQTGLDSRRETWNCNAIGTSQTGNGNLKDAPDLFRTFHKTSQQLQEGNELEATNESTYRFMQFIYVSRMFGCTRSGH